MPVRTLIVDDEPLARERIRTLLAAEPDVVVVGECGDGREAIETIEKHAPDLVFLDVQMPGLDGFAVLEALVTERMPVVVFVTAYDRYALRAFDVHAVDYLLKPFDHERFRLALRRAIDHIVPDRGAELGRRLSALLDDLSSRRAPAERIAVRLQGRVVLLKTEEIDWIEAADNYVNLHVGEKTHLLRHTLGALEARLPADRFLRINRSAIVNVDRIEELHPKFHGEYGVVLRDGTKLSLSRAYRDNVSSLLGKTP